MNTIAHNKLRRFVIVTSVCLLVLMVAASALLMNPLISFAQSNQLNNALKTLSTGSAIVQIMTVQNQPKPILATPGGLALYYLEGQNASNPLCNGNNRENSKSPICNKDWPPLLFTGSGTPPSPPGITLQVKQNGNGYQVEYEGNLLYTYSDDATNHTIGGATDSFLGHNWELATVYNPPVSQQSLRDIQHRIDADKTSIGQLRHQMDVIETNMSKDMHTLNVHNFNVKKFEDCVKDHSASQC